MIRIALILLMSAVLTGCGLFGQGGGDAKMHYKHECKVSIDQSADVENRDDFDTAETIQINPDCSVTIDAERILGDDVEDIKVEGDQNPTLIQQVDDAFSAPPENIEEQEP